MARDPAHSAPLPSATRSEALGLPPLFVALPFEQGCRLLPPSGHALVEGMINLAIPQTHVLRSLPFGKVLLVLVYWATVKVPQLPTQTTVNLTTTSVPGMYMRARYIFRSQVFRTF